MSTDQINTHELKKEKLNLDVTVETISPKVAEEYLLKNIHNRKVSETTVNFYAHQMVAGEWVISPEGIAFDRLGNLIDGQHRLLAIIKANVKVQMLVMRNFDTDTFKVINTGKSRNGADVLSIDNVTNAGLVYSGLRKFMALRLGKSIRDSNKQLKLSNTNFLDVYEEDPEFFKKIASSSNKYYKQLRILTNSEILGYTAFLVKDKKHPIEKVNQFFFELVTTSENNLINQLKNVIFKSKTSNYKLDGEMREALIIKTWNSFITNTHVDRLRWNSVTEKFPTFL